MAEEERGLVKRVRLWNDGAKDFDQEVNGTRYTIPAGKCIEVGRRVAVEIRGTYLGKNVPVNLRMEPLPEKGFETPKEMEKISAQSQVWCCPVCDKEHASKAAMKNCYNSHPRRGRKPRKANKDDSSTSTDND